jgi:salicylate hydroxylase
MKIAIIGGGIGGLTAALALAQSSREITVFEHATAFREVGAGVQISPNGGRVLRSLGLGEAFDKISVYPERMVFRRWEDDSVIRANQFDEAFVEQFGMPLSSVARTDLIEILAQAVAAVPTISVSLGSHVTHVEPGTETSTVFFADATSLSFDLVIGADGIHSVVRPCVGGADSARFSGSVAYRALVPLDAVNDLPIDFTNRVGPDRHVVSYFIGKDRRYLNLVCISPEESWTTESWTEPGTLDDLRQRFEGWSPELLSILDRVEEPVFRWALYDREPLEQWGIGSTTLLGDAGHPMLPFMAQGSCQAMEDAAILGRCLDDVDDSDGSDGTAVIAALRRYEAARQGRTAQVQNTSFMNRDLFHMPDGEMQQGRDEFLASGVAGFGPLEWVYSYDALTAAI